MIAVPTLLLLAAMLAPRPSLSNTDSARMHQSDRSPLDFAIFKTRVQPIFLNKRPGLARCYVCHSQGTPFRLQPLSPGATEWNQDESRQNFEAIQRLVVPGSPLASRLLTMPLAAEAGGVAFHPGGKRWSSQDDDEWKLLAAWVRGEIGSLRREEPLQPATGMMSLP